MIMNSEVFITDGHWRKTLAAVRALGEQGIRVTVGESTRLATAAFSRHCHKAVVYPSPFFRPTEFIDYLHSKLSSRSDVEKMIISVVEQWEYVDILINNAGIIRDKLLMFLNEDDWDRVIDVNLKGTYLCSRAIIRTMIAQKFGRIINISSPSAITGRSGQTNYAASKGGIISFTKSLAKEMARLGITVNAVCPGVIVTPMTENLNQENICDITSRIPMGRLGQPEDVAEAVLFLASEKTGYITGQVLAVDGGLT